MKVFDGLTNAEIVAGVQANMRWAYMLPNTDRWIEAKEQSLVALIGALKSNIKCGIIKEEQDD